MNEFNEEEALVEQRETIEKLRSWAVEWGFLERMSEPGEDLLNLTRVFTLNAWQKWFAPNEVNPMSFALAMRNCFKALVGEDPLASGMAYDQVFYGQPVGFTWTWEHVWHEIGEPAFYKPLIFVPSREECFLQQHSHTGLRASMNAATIVGQFPNPKKENISQSSVRLPNGSWCQVVIREPDKAEDTTILLRFMPTGTENMTGPDWQGAFESSAATLAVRALTPEGAAGVDVQEKRDTKDSDVDAIISWSEGQVSKRQCVQVVRLAVPELWKGVHSGKETEVRLTLDTLCQAFEHSISKKRDMAVESVVLLVDFDLALPRIEPLVSRFRKLLASKSIAYSSVFLVCRVDRECVHLYGRLPLRESRPRQAVPHIGARLVPEAPKKKPD